MFLLKNLVSLIGNIILVNAEMPQRVLDIERYLEYISTHQQRLQMSEENNEKRIVKLERHLSQTVKLMKGIPDEQKQLHSNQKRIIDANINFQKMLSRFLNNWKEEDKINNEIKPVDVKGPTYV